MSEELQLELAAMRRLIERLAIEIERLSQQLTRTEHAAQWVVPGRPRDDDDGSD